MQQNDAVIDTLNSINDYHNNQQEKRILMMQDMAQLAISSTRSIDPQVDNTNTTITTITTTTKST
jgi:hypothetical protein